MQVSKKYLAEQEVKLATLHAIIVEQSRLKVD